MYLWNGKAVRSHINQEIRVKGKKSRGETATRLRCRWQRQTEEKTECRETTENTGLQAIRRLHSRVLHCQTPLTLCRRVEEGGQWGRRLRKDTVWDGCESQLGQTRKTQTRNTDILISVTFTYFGYHYHSCYSALLWAGVCPPSAVQSLLLMERLNPANFTALH